MPDVPYGRPDSHEAAGPPCEQADSFSQSQAVVPVPPTRVLAVLTEVTRWPGRFPGMTGARAAADAGTYELRFHGSRFEISLERHGPPHRIGWSGTGAGVRLHQTWLLTPTGGGGTHVVTDNVVTREVVADNVVAEDVVAQDVVTAEVAAENVVTVSPSWAHRLNALWLAQVEALTADGAPPPVRTER